MPNDKNTELVREAVRAFKKATRTRARLVQGHLTLQFMDWKDRLKVIPFPRVDEATIGFAKFNNAGEDCILAARHVTPAKAELLKEMGLAFIDAAGNAFINRGPLFVYIRGNPPRGNMNEKRVNLFRQTGVKVVFALLCRPGMENETYRKIAAEADVALGGIGRVFDDLERTGFLLRRGRRELRIVNRNKLLNRWVTAYIEQLYPRLVLGRFAPIEEAATLTTNKVALPGDTFWGGEFAAERMVKHLIPGRAMLYTTQDVDDLALRLRLKADPDGDIQILRKFWRFTWEEEEEQLAPPLLVYANLLAAGNGRNIETAGIIYDQRLQAVTA